MPETHRRVSRSTRMLMTPWGPAWRRRARRRARRPRASSRRRADRAGRPPRAAAGIEEVRRLAAGLRDHVERRHHEPGAVAQDADVAVELDVGQAALLGHL